MSARTRQGLGLAILICATGVARAQHHGGGGSSHHGGEHHHQSATPALAAVAGGYASYGFWPYFVAGPGLYAPYPVVMMAGPPGYFAPPGGTPPPMLLRAPLPPPPPPMAVADRAEPAKPAAGDPGRASQLVTFGDRLFRAGNIKRAAERYLQASHAAPNLAAPQVRLALIASARGQYSEAADRLRDAETAEPGWLATAPDIESMFGEPAQFLRHLARLESFVQSHPDDRDAWLVLGASWFLSGRTARAADVFLRLDDPNRKPDVALAAFLFASNHPRPKAGQGGH